MEMDEDEDSSSDDSDDIKPARGANNNTLRDPKRCRMFTLRAVEHCELITLSVANLMNM